MDNTIIQQGRFTSDGTNKTLSIRSDVDWMMVYNYTNAGATGDDSVQFFWQRGMADGTGLRYFKSGGGNALNMTALASPNGFQLVDTAGNPNGARIVVSAGTNATQPVFSTANTAGLATGSIVRMDSLATAPDLNGFDFEIDTIVANTSFRMRYALANAPGSVSGAGFYRRIKFDPIFYPRRRFIVNITQAAQAVVRTSVRHGYTVGQVVRFTVPPFFGMVELDGLQGTIVATNGAAEFTVDIDSSAFSAFTFVTAAQAANPFNWAQVAPLGEDTAAALDAGANLLGDATENEALLGMILPAGADAPGGATSDVMYWVAGKSFAVNNE